MTVQRIEKGQTLNEAPSALLQKRKLFGQILYDDFRTNRNPFELCVAAHENEGDLFHGNTSR